jgi:enterobactin synthetase component D
MDEPTPYRLTRVPGIAVQMARFYPERYSDACFAQYSVSFPEPAMSRSVPKRRAEFLAGRVCAARALREAGSEVHELRAGEDRAPLWPKHLVGSITHNRDRAAAVALSRPPHRGVGIDVEEIAAGSTLEALRHLVISGPEHEVIGEAAADLGPLLTCVFSAKESFYKAAYPSVGRVFGFEALRLTRVDRDAQSLEFLLCDRSIAASIDLAAVRIHFEWIDANTVITMCVL